MMHRRKLLYYGMVSTATCLINSSLIHPVTAKTKVTKIYDWIFLYWMPYDNNLARFAQPVMQMLTQSVPNDNMLVCVQSDRFGEQQLQRHIITHNNIYTQKLNTGDSGDEQVFADYLKYAKTQFQAQRWVIVFLGHGGSLAEISPDDHPYPNRGNKWMNIHKLSKIITNFNQQVNNKLELVFFQNCNKGTIEVNYTLRNTVKYTLSSQLLLGAPNYYYQQLFTYLSQNTQVNGAELAMKIMEFEQKDMYHSYTLTNNQNLGKLPSKINPLIDAIVKSNIGKIDLNTIKTYIYLGERYTDSLQFFQYLTNESGVNQQLYQDLADFIQTKMIYKVQQGGTLLENRDKYKDFCGLGIFLPSHQQELDKYRYLQVFNDLKLTQLFKKVLL